MSSSTSTSHKRGSHHSGAHGGGDGGSHEGGGGGGGGGGKLVKVAFARNQVEAEMIQGLLGEAGIPSVLKRARGFDAPEFLAAGPHDVLVDSSHAQKAKTLLADTITENEADEEAELRERSALRHGGPGPTPRRRGWRSGSASPSSRASSSSGSSTS